MVSRQLYLLQDVHDRELIQPEKAELNQCCVCQVGIEERRGGDKLLQLGTLSVRLLLVLDEDLLHQSTGYSVDQSAILVVTRAERLLYGLLVVWSLPLLLCQV